MPIGTSAGSCPKAGTPARLSSDDAPSPAITCRRSSRPFESIMASLRCRGVEGEIVQSSGRDAVVDPQRIVEAIEKAGQRNPQRQFDDLRLAEMKPQPFQYAVADTSGVLRHQRPILDHQP